MTADKERDVVSAVPTGLLIGSEWRESGSGGRFEVEDPSTGEVIATVADATVDDGDAALSAAVAAQPSWAATAARERGELLRRAFELVRERSDDLAVLMTLEMGKAVKESRAEITYAAEFLRWFSEEAARVAGRYSQAPAGGSRLLTMKQPVGPSFFIMPWNFPTAMGTRKIAPAVAAGCTMVVKPAHETPLSMLALAEILREAGLPDGVLNVIPTSTSGTVSEPIIRDPRLRKLSFTGSTAVGRTLIEQSAQQVLRVSMELGGNAPFLVFADADLDAAVDGAMLAKMRNVGEACTAANRFHVHESVAAEFTDRLAERMSALRLGRGTDAGVDVGPLVSAKQRGTVEELVADAVDRGAKVVTGGGRWGDAGYFYQPTVLGQVAPDARILAEEVFGPVAPISTFSSDEEALAAANDTEFGLVAYVFTRDLERALRVSEGLEVGMVGLNAGIVSNPAAPFGGVKASGFGREGGVEGIEEYLETKYVAVSLPS
ncbi:NAD-dependent succinate-semialdehyde dehydrogenase [Jiangella asiatica]|uniref:NAD-dependent succinate-semialdehyde dehydrogenase n=1 Tax=Jiangella asiatica TaxID=2530372 RepID=A0A4R5D983_9ACTN|nr:NAD-dependent succinate-semialdehyde dehydrogenase [Jiangella asiatica]TDE10096.1 NAD-dependent succinate-semialdehyde dehydrogenase [Jiangella asiatica]